MESSVLSPLAGMRLFLYARKSSENSERQVQSIPDQFAWGRAQAQQRGFTIIDCIPEEKSAKEPGIRPRFADMLRRIQAGEADGIISWQINRLIRNPVDGGQVQWMLQCGVLKVIVTNERDHWPSDNTLLLSIDTGMSTQYVRDLAVNSWRGTLAKIDKGWFPSRVGVGYLNDPHGTKGEKKIFVDPDRWDAVRRIWDLLLTGAYTTTQVKNIVNADGFRTRRNLPLSSASLLAILTNPFYTGTFTIRGQTYQGSHQPMISQAEFDRVQQLLGDRHRFRPHSREFAYTGLMHCGECGRTITAETKSRYIRTTGETHVFTYYRCTKKNTNCRQKTIRVEALEQQISQRLAALTIHPDLAALTARVLRREQSREAAASLHIQQQQQAGISRLQTELYDLQKTYTKGTLDDDFYLYEKASLKQRLTQAERQQASLVSGEISRVDELVTNLSLFGSHAAVVFEGAPLRTKRAMLMALGSEFQLLDGQLVYEPAPWFSKLQQFARAYRLETERSARTAVLEDLQMSLVRACQKMVLWSAYIRQIRALLAEASSKDYTVIPHIEPDRIGQTPFTAIWLTRKTIATPDRALTFNNRMTHRLAHGEIAQLITEYQTGASTRHLAAQHSMSPTTVKSLLRQHGCQLRPPGGQLGRRKQGNTGSNS